MVTLDKNTTHFIEDRLDKISEKKQEISAGIHEEYYANMMEIIRNAIKSLKFNQEDAGAIYKRCLEHINNINTKYNNKIISTADFTAILTKTIMENESEDFLHAFIRSLGYRHLYINKSESTEKVNTLPFVIRENGYPVFYFDFKVYNSIKNALNRYSSDQEIGLLCEKVKNKVILTKNEAISLETVQDFILLTLLENGHIQAMKKYIESRAQKAENRMDIFFNEEILKVVEEDGTESLWMMDELRAKTYFAMQNLNISLSHEEVYNQMRRNIYNGIHRKDLEKTIILNAKSLMEYDYDFSLFAGRILLFYIYEKALGWNIITHGIDKLDDMHKENFAKSIHRGVELGLLDKRLLEYDLDYISSFIDYRYDFNFTYLGIQTLYDRYLLYDKSGKLPKLLETPQFFWLRVAMGLNLLEDKSIRENKVIDLYNLYRNRLACSSTPTLFNSGTVRPQLSSCYLYDVEDSIESIMERGIAEMSYLSKWAGGLGGSWTKVRGAGAKIKGTNGYSNGVIPFLKIHNDMLFAVNQGGKRNGSGAAYLEVWHSDIYDFIELRRNTGDERRRTHDLNTAVWIPDLFMKRVEQRSYWTLFHSNEVPELPELYGKEFEDKYTFYEEQYEQGKIWGRRIEALDLWKNILRMLYETGHPWITFKDACNVRNPQSHVGVIHSSNLCTEITLNTSSDEVAVCNLMSIVLDEHFDETTNELDWNKLRETIRICVRTLDNVIDINYYPIKAAANANLRHRAVGLGIMGWANLLFKKGIDFESEEAVEYADKVMEFIAYEAYSASSDLAVERGAYSSFEGSKWSKGILPHDTVDYLSESRCMPILVNRIERLDWNALREKIKKQKMRNSNVIAIAPTATISNIMGTSQSIEPIYSNMYVKSNLSGDFIVINKFLEMDLKKLNLWNENIRKKIKYYDGDLSHIKEIPESIAKKYKTAFDIDYRYIIDAAAARQKWIDQAQSLNLYLRDPDLKKLSHMYKYAWKTGLKTTYYLRTLGATSIEKYTVTSAEVQTQYDGKYCSLDSGCESCQ
jgi:ribonucleoside-diphosphate reductase alpha chain